MGHTRQIDEQSNTSSAGLGKVYKITILKVTTRKGKFINICAYEARQTMKEKKLLNANEPRGFNLIRGIQNNNNSRIKVFN